MTNVILRRDKSKDLEPMFGETYDKEVLKTVEEREYEMTINEYKQ